MQLRVAACGLALLLLAGCAGQSSTPTSAPQSAKPQAASAALFRVGMSRTAPPLAFRDSGQTRGLEADFAQALADELDRELQIVPVFWPELLIELEAHRIDIIMSGMTVTSLRKQRAAFTEPYVTVGQMPLVRAAEAKKLTTRDSIEGYEGRVGVELGSTGEDWVRLNMPKATVTALRTMDELIAAIGKDQVDMVVHDSPTVVWYARDNPQMNLAVAPVRLTDEQLAWAVDRDNDELLAAANAALKRWRESGELERMLDQWIPADVRGATTN